MQAGHHILKTSIPFVTAFLPRAGYQIGVLMSLVSDKCGFSSYIGHVINQLTTHIENIYKDSFFIYV
jgi:hypothetical protein